MATMEPTQLRAAGGRGEAGRKGSVSAARHPPSGACWPAGPSTARLQLRPPAALNPHLRAVPPSSPFKYCPDGSQRNSISLILRPPETGFLKKRTEETTTATRFMVLPTLKVTGEMPASSTM